MSYEKHHDKLKRRLWLLGAAIFFSLLNTLLWVAPTMAGTPPTPVPAMGDVGQGLYAVAAGVGGVYMLLRARSGK
ncbi:MAG: hypothetical protein HQL05_08475 [Nitrospirae bacterium]|uniref:hypothetical protein n=1 Tax=Candidatus Magnetobacterium casense TaxID=1455061 RepID=UPI00058C6E3F|nr:hypothetical protein [Candidatus Magnetobacterium casensis]MBF0337854.1 hypothetical protein [Nitrospirota bacterium]